jgi:dUTP pyrophosphatase
MQLLVKKLKENAIIPSYGSRYAAGMDLYAYGEHFIEAGTRKLIPTGISIEWKGEDANKYYIRIAPRSGLAVKHSIDIGAGVVDFDYRGEIFVCFINNGPKDYKIAHGDRIAQMILEKINIFEEIIEISQLTNTERGEGGFGSTGN